MSRSQINDVLYLGVDGGGSKCQAQIAHVDGTLLGVGRSGPANPLHGMARAIESITEAANLALSDAGLEGVQLCDLVAGVGLAGVNLPSIYQAMMCWQHPFGQMYLTTDLEIACLGAHGGNDGAVIISGTGSCGFSCVGAESLTIGGHGFNFGDYGSGAWTGLEAVRAALLAEDNMGQHTCLSAMIEQELGVCRLGMVEQLAGQASNRFARLAPLVLRAAESGDEVAISILQRGGAYLSEMARKLMQLQPPRLTMIGGFSKPMMAWMGADVVSMLSPALESPELGAIYFARQQHGRSEVVSA